MTLGISYHCYSPLRVLRCDLGCYLLLSFGEHCNYWDMTPVFYTFVICLCHLADSRQLKGWPTHSLGHEDFVDTAHANDGDSLFLTQHGNRDQDNRQHQGPPHCKHVNCHHHQQNSQMAASSQDHTLAPAQLCRLVSSVCLTQTESLLLSFSDLIIMSKNSI